MTDKNRRAKLEMEQRMNIISGLYKKGYTLRAIAEIVKTQMGLKSGPSIRTIQKDQERLLAQWQKERNMDVQASIELELARIDYACTELWEAWEKSKTDHKSKFSKQKGFISKPTTAEEVENRITPQSMEQGVKEEINFGDPRYIAEIRNQLTERRKILGVYGPIKVETTGPNGGPVRYRNETPAIDDIYDKLSESALQEIANAYQPTEKE